MPGGMTRPGGMPGPGCWGRIPGASGGGSIAGCGVGSGGCCGGGCGDGDGEGEGDDDDDGVLGSAKVIRTWVVPLFKVVSARLLLLCDLLRFSDVFCCS